MRCVTRAKFNLTLCMALPYVTIQARKDIRAQPHKRTKAANKENSKLVDILDKLNDHHWPPVVDNEEQQDDRSTDHPARDIISWEDVPLEFMDVLLRDVSLSDDRFSL
jgi:hypothetical protein